jgi:hypothetical protein
MKSHLTYIAIIGSFSLFQGCAALSENTELGGTREMMRTMKPRNTDMKSAGEQGEETWVKDVGVEARGDQPIQHSSDPIDKWWLSDQARSIERNLGYD